MFISNTLLFYVPLCPLPSTYCGLMHSRHAKSRKTSVNWFLRNRNFPKRVRKPKLRLITTTTRFLLQDFHIFKNFHKLMNFAGITWKLAFFISSMLKIYTKFITPTEINIYPLYFVMFLVEIFPRSPKIFGAWHLRHSPLLACLTYSWSHGPYLTLQ